MSSTTFAAIGLAVRDPAKTSYRPVLAVFAVAALMALAASWAAFGALRRSPRDKVHAFSMCILAMLKLRTSKNFVDVPQLRPCWPARRALLLYLPFRRTDGGRAADLGRAALAVDPDRLVHRHVGAVSCSGGLQSTSATSVRVRRAARQCPAGFVSLTENV